MSKLTWVATSEDTARVVGSHGRVLADYSYSDKKNHPYFSQLRPLVHDGVLTNHAPWDHRWHHGLWWSWKFIDDVLYWEDHEDYGGNRRGLGRAVVVGHRVDHEGEAIVVSEDLEWRENASGRIALREQRRLQLSEDPESRTWTIDWDHTWEGEDPVRFGVTNYPEHSWGGYAGLNFRPARSLAVGEEIRASHGRLGTDQVHGESVDWVSLMGNVDGSGSDDPDHPAFGGVILVQHPKNTWGGRSAYAFSAATGFGFVATAPLMHQDQKLAPGDPLRLRYRTIVVGEKISVDRIDQLAGAYCDSPSQ